MSPITGSVRTLLAALFSALFSLGLVAGTAAAIPPDRAGGPSDRAQERAMGYYLALGDSLSTGFQPEVGDEREGAYVGGVLKVIQAKHPKTRLRNVGCGGATMISMIEGGGCGSDTYNQLGAALKFLKQHGKFTRVITIDIGANDVQRCVKGGAVDMGCVMNGLAGVEKHLSPTIGKLRAAAPRAQIVVLNYYNPFLAAYLTGPAGQELAKTSVQLQGILNGIIAKAAADNGAQLADVAAAFDSTNWTPTPAPGLGTVPTNVARICGWTWMCARNDIHANDAGYQVLAQSVAKVLR